jgi:hypothetical protein
MREWRSDERRNRVTLYRRHKYRLKYIVHDIELIHINSDLPMVWRSLKMYNLTLDVISIYKVCAFQIKNELMIIVTIASFIKITSLSCQIEIYLSEYNASSFNERINTVWNKNKIYWEIIKESCSVLIKSKEKDYKENTK